MIIDKFNSITGLRVDTFISSYTSFVDTDLTKIVNFYSGLLSKPDLTSFRNLSSLIDQSKTLNESIMTNSRLFDNAEYWDLVEVLSDIHSSLETAANTARWVRSTRANNDFNTNPEVDVVLSSRTTIESLARTSGYQEPIDSWVNIALRNDLDEDKYTVGAGNVLKINMLGSKSFVIDDVVDTISGDNMYGKDIKTVFKYTDNDLETVEGEPCLFQSYNTLLKLSRGDIQEFVDMGLSPVIGSNIAVFSYPVVLRQLHRTFDRDSSVDAVSILDFNIQDDNMVMNVLIESKFGSFLKTGVII